MQRTKIFLTSIIFATQVLAQVPPEARVGFESISTGDMRAVLGFLASDLLEGRETGERGLDLAARFLETQFALHGLTAAPGAASMLQHFDLVQSQITDNTVISIQTQKTPEQRYHWLEDFYGTNLGASSSTITGDVVFAGFGISAPDAHWDDYQNIEVRDKIVLLLSSRGLNSIQEGTLA